MANLCRRCRYSWPLNLKRSHYSLNPTPSIRSQIQSFNHLRRTKSTLIAPDKKIEKVLLVQKPKSEQCNSALKSIFSFIEKSFPNITPLVEGQVLDPDLRKEIDLVIALGGDGTILHVSYLFKNIPCPPILGFNLGTIGFLLPFPPLNFNQVVKMVINGKFSTEERMRLSCNLSHSERSYSKPHDNSPKELFSPIGLSAMNEVSIHRSHSPHMIPLNISIEGELLTQAVADGLIIATPTGSTAYSCSAGGPIVHPNMEAILVTPICPRSLSFRPLILPSDVTLKLNLDPRSESPAELNLDGISIATIKPGESIEVKRSDSPIKLYTPCTGFSTNYYWINDLNLMLNFNQSFQSKQPSPVIKLK